MINEEHKTNGLISIENFNPSVTLITEISKVLCETIKSIKEYKIESERIEAQKIIAIKFLENQNEYIVTALKNDHSKQMIIINQLISNINDNLIKESPEMVKFFVQALVGFCTSNNKILDSGSCFSSKEFLKSIANENQK